MKSVGERNWVKMSTHGRKEFLSGNGHDKKLATATWSQLPDEVKANFTVNPVSAKQEAALA